MQTQESRRGAIFWITAGIAREALVTLVSVAVGYAFYSALQWVAAEADRRSSGTVLRAPLAAFAGEEQ